jgi:YD repeat-containing protein
MAVLLRISVAAVVALSAATAMAGETITYRYDARGRLVQVQHSGTVNNNVKTVYTHDKASNRKNVTTTTS